MTDTVPTTVEDMEAMDAKEDGPIQTDATNDTNEMMAPPTTSSNAGYIATSTIPTMPKKQPNRIDDDKENKPLLANPIPIGKEKDNNRAKFIALIVIILLIITGFLIAYFLWINPSESGNTEGGNDDPLIDDTTFQPTFEPTFEPTMNPSIMITMNPTTTTISSTTTTTTSSTEQDTLSPSMEPTSEPTLEPTTEPTLEPTQGSNDGSSSSSMDSNLIIGLSIGGGILILYILCCFFYCCCCKENENKNKNENENENKDNGYDEIKNDGGCESELAIHTNV